MYGMYDKDLIAERDAREKVQNSIIKWWRVNYVDNRIFLNPQESQKIQVQSSATMPLSKSVPVAEEQPLKSDYNATTGSYSGAYGKHVTLDEEGLSQVDSILNEKNSVFMGLLEEIHRDGQ